MEYCIGVDLGGTNIAAGVVNLKFGRIVAKGSVKTRALRPSAEIAEDIVALCHSIAKEAGATLASMKWIGVATPGIVKDGVVISANNLRWTNANLANDVQSRAGVKTYVSNDENVAAYAEALWGSVEHKVSLVVITLGTGVGGGISGEGDNLILLLRREIERISFGTDGNRTEVVAAKFRNDAGIIDSALLGKQEEVAKMNAELRSIIDNLSTPSKLCTVKAATRTPRVSLSFSP